MPYFAIAADDGVYDRVTSQAITPRFVPKTAMECAKGQRMPAEVRGGRWVAMSAKRAAARAGRRAKLSAAQNQINEEYTDES